MSSPNHTSSGTPEEEEGARARAATVSASSAAAKGPPESTLLPKYEAPRLTSSSLIEEEVPLEIEDFNCANSFEEVVNAVERFLRHMFQTQDELKSFVLQPSSSRGRPRAGPPASHTSRSASSASDDSGDSSGERKHGSSSASFASLHSASSGGGDNGEGAGEDGAVSAQTSVPCVFGHNFPIERRRGRFADGTVEDMLAVEIHVHDHTHPVARQYCLPLFLVAKSVVAQQSTCRESESTYYLSILSTAAGNVFGPHQPLSVDLGEGWFNQLPSFYYYHQNCVPCFAPVGDLFQQTYIGLSPPLALPLPQRDPAASPTPAATLTALVSQPVLCTKFTCSAYPQPPQGCQYLCDFIDLFQLHIGRHSRIRMDEFEGICVSLRKSYVMTIPWQFQPLVLPVPSSSSPSGSTETASSTRLTREGITEPTSWNELIVKENDEMILLCGPHTNPFGTQACPLEEFRVDFQWNQLHDSEAFESTNRSYLNPFLPSSSVTAAEANRKCSVTTQAVVTEESAIRHIVTSRIGMFVQLALKRVAQLASGVSEAAWRHTVSGLSSGSTVPTLAPESLTELADRVLRGYHQRPVVQEMLLARFAAREPADDATGDGGWMRLTHRKKVPPPLSPTAAGPVKDLRTTYFPGSFLARFGYYCAEELEVAADVHRLWLVCIKSMKHQFEKGGSQNLSAVLDAIGLPVCEPVVDLAQPLMVQKLQLLAYCVRALLLQSGQRVPTSSRAGAEPSPAPPRPTDGWNEEEEDAVKDDGPHPSSAKDHAPLSASFTDDVAVPSAEKSSTASSSTARVMRLITNGEVLVQPPPLPQPPCTSDTVLQRAKELAQLGTSSVAQATRTWLQSDSLYNDMCLFQYANEVQHGRVVRFPDFIQWHSPRDFVQPAAPTKDDNAYLTDRMQRHPEGESASHVWWSLWARAVPRGREQIIAESFHHYDQAALLFRWLESQASESDVLLEVASAVMANASHRIASHRLIVNHRGLRPNLNSRSSWSSAGRPSCAPIPGLRGYVKDKINSFSTNVQAAHAMFSSGAPIGALSASEMEAVLNMFAVALRELAEAETSLSAAVALEALIGRYPDPASDGAQLVRAVSTPAPRQTDVAGLRLRAQPVTLAVWSAVLAPRFTRSQDRQPREMTARLTCAAERPLNTTGCFQQLVAHRESSGVLRMALALSEEVL